MTELLTESLPLLAGAPNGIKKLRELILELAVRGKLLPQNPSDEPASDLLNRIAAEKARLVVSGKTKKQNPLVEIAKKERPFALPPGWSWARLADLVNVLNGRAYKKEELLDSGTPVLRVGNLFTSRHWYYSDLELEENKYCSNGDLIFAWSASFGPFIWAGDRVIYHYHIWKLDLYTADWLDKRYLYTSLLKQTQEIKAAGHGVSMVHMTKEKMEKLVVPVPPLAEQKRIVAKVDELMALCDRLESRQTDAESSHARIVTALLDSLIQANDATDFATSWQRLAEHFHTLFTTESSIDTLKQTLLQLAVMGKLAPQTTGFNACIESEVEQQPYDLPHGWSWCKFGSTWESSFYGPRFGKDDYVTSGGTPTIRTTDMNSNGFIEMRNPPQVKVPTEKLNLYKLSPGDLLVTRSGSIGTMALFREDILAIPSAYLIRIRFLPIIAPQFGLLYLRSPLGQNLLGLNSTSVGVPNVNATKMALFPLPLPPIEEQHRIVAKVDELMTFCDRLKTKLTQARQLNEQLAVGLVERALMADTNVGNTAIDQEKARTLLAAEIVQQLHCEKRMGRVKLQKVISLAEHVARLQEIQSKEERFAAGPHDPALMKQATKALRENQWFEELELEDGKRYEYRPLVHSGAHRAAYDALWSSEQRRQINELIELMRPWDTARCERVATLYSAWNDLLIEGREVSEAAILQEVLHGWNESKLKYTETQWRAELAEMQQHSFLIPTGFGKRTSGGKLTLPGFEPSI